MEFKLKGVSQAEDARFLSCLVLVNVLHSFVSTKNEVGSCVMEGKKETSGDEFKSFILSLFHTSR